MSSIAVAGAVRAVRRADAKSMFFWGKLFFCLICPPVAVALELHSVDTVSLWIIGASFVLWMFGFLPGVAFALFIVLSSTGKDKVLSWFKKKEEPAPATGISSWFKRTKPAADAETGTAKPAAKPAAAAAPAAPAAAPAAKPAEVKVVAPPAAAPAAATAAAPAAAPAAAAAAPAAPSGVGGWFGGGVS